MATPARALRRVSLVLTLSLAPVAGGIAGTASAQTADNVGVVINDNSPVSRQVGEYYVRKRGIPASNVFHIKTSTDETIERGPYVTTIEQPLGASIARQNLQDKLLYLVLTKGIPLRIPGTSGGAGTVASVDSELTVLYSRMAGDNIPVPGRVNNPYFLGTRPMTAAGRFTHKDYPIFLVTRLDAFTVQEALGLVDKSLAAAKDGRIVLDQQDKLVDRTGEEWLKTASDRLKAQGVGDRVVFETTVKGVRGVAPVLGYYSWGSNDPGNRVRKFDLGFVPGSIASMFVSTDARTFKEPPATWTPGDSNDPARQFAGSAQSLIGDLIREGATGVAGHVSEPDLESTVRPEILFPAYMAGFNLVEAFYLAMPHLSWQTVVIGDPLCAPFRRAPIPPSDIDAGRDPETEWPVYFSQRRLKVIKTLYPNVSDRTLTLGIRGESRLARGDVAGARASFEEVTRLAPNLVGAQLQLAVLLDNAGQRDGAIERYRRVLEIQPKNVVALNNLAYDLAAFKHDPNQALPYAQQAGAIEPTNPLILDTLAWIEHLRGNDDISIKLIAIVVQRLPERGDVRLRAAAIYAAKKQVAMAESELKEALRLDPSLEKRDETRQVREQIAALRR